MRKIFCLFFAALTALWMPTATMAAVVDLNASTANPLSPTIVLNRYVKGANFNFSERGDNCGIMVATVTAGASDSNTSTYRVFNNLEPGLVPLMVLIANDANTSGTSYSLGLYAGTANGAIGGAAIAANAFMNAQTMASARASLGPGTALDGMSNIGTANFGKALWQIGGDATITTRPLGYDLTITANTAGSAGGNMTVLLIYGVPQNPKQ